MLFLEQCRDGAPNLSGLIHKSLFLAHRQLNAGDLCVTFYLVTPVTPSSKISKFSVGFPVICWMIATHQDWCITWSFYWLYASAIYTCILLVITLIITPILEMKHIFVHSKKVKKKKLVEKNPVSVTVTKSKIINIFSNYWFAKLIIWSKKWHKTAG